ncbi:MAG: RHS repeat-associated core domain-containing protein, partial [bacterium]|nr:RHS repeat-associated core domain-containing protein [bacterium]
VEKAFGSNRYVANPNGYLPTDRFTDQALDLETGLYWYGSRYYDPAVGRYLQPDDVVPAPFDTQGRNPYTYVRNNPLGLTDPTGNAAENILEWIWRRISGNDAMEGSGSGAPEGWDVPAPVWTAGSANGQLKKALDPIVEPVAKEIVRVVDKGANAAAAGFEDGSAAPYEVPTHIALTLAGTDFNVDPLSGYHNAFQSESGAGLFEKTMYGGGAIFGLMTWTLPAGKGASATLSSRPLLFGQKGVSNVFSHGVHKGKTLGTVAKGLREGKILADSLPINFVVRNGQRVTVNNRSLTALRMARKEPTIVVNKTGQRIWERRLTNNLKGSKGPSDTIRVRNGPPGTSNIE